MKREYAEALVVKYMKRIYAFVYARIANESDVADLTQDICLKVYKTAYEQEIYAEDSFVWSIARHTLANYYRGKSKTYHNISIEDMNMEDIRIEEMVIDNQNDNMLELMIKKESVSRIQKEIAYLSKMQRKILIMYYYEEKKQADIAGELNIPLGTVKWHLSMAKEELKKGMKKMRDINELKFNPIEFGMVGISGSDGDLGWDFFRSALSQNIMYAIWQDERSIEDIADILNVSPVYVESEMEFLEKYSLVLKKGNKYIANVLIEEATEEGNAEHNKLYSKVSADVANQLYDELVKGEYLCDKDIYVPDGDRNFAMWSLVFYLLAWVESDFFEEKLKFEDIATYRADGGKNIITATVSSKVGDEYLKAHHMNEQCGPCWNANDDVILWLIDGEWTEKRVGKAYGGPNIERDLRLLKRFVDGELLSVDEYTFLLEKKYICKCGDKFKLAIVMLKEGNLSEKLYALTKGIKNEVFSQYKAEIERYKERCLMAVKLPENMKKQKEFVLQYMFHSDGWFMRYAKEALVESGRLQEVDMDKKGSLTEILIVKK